MPADLNDTLTSLAFSAREALRHQMPELASTAAYASTLRGIAPDPALSTRSLACAQEAERLVPKGLVAQALKDARAYGLGSQVSATARADIARLSERYMTGVHVTGASSAWAHVGAQPGLVAGLRAAITAAAPAGAVSPPALRGIECMDALNERLSRQLHSVLPRPSSALTEQLKSFNKACMPIAGVANAWVSAGLAPSLAERMRSSLGVPGVMPMALSSTLANAHSVSAISERVQRYLGVAPTAGLAAPWASTLAGTMVRQPAVLSRIAEMAAEAERMQRMAERIAGPALEHMRRMEVGVGSAYMGSPLAAASMASAGTLPPNAITSLVAEANAMSVALAPLARQLKAPEPLAARSPLIEALERERTIWDAAQRFIGRWEQTTLWFILGALGMRQLYLLAHMDAEEVESALLDALEVVVVEGKYVAALRAAVKKAPHLSSDQREDLRHGLEHAKRGEFVCAAPPLMLGLEGALWSTARALSIIDAERRHLAGKPQKRSVVRIEPVVRKLPVKQEYQAFVCGRVFGDRGNPVRHGEQSDRRRQALFAVVAIAGWVDDFMGLHAREVLGRMLRSALPLDDR